MTYKPPYEINSNIIDLISKISLNIGKLEALEHKTSLVILRKINQNYYRNFLKVFSEISKKNIRNMWKRSSKYCFYRVCTPIYFRSHRQGR